MPLILFGLATVKSRIGYSTKQVLKVRQMAKKDQKGFPNGFSPTKGLYYKTLTEPLFTDP